MLNEPTIVSYQAQEASHLRQILRSWPLRYSSIFWGCTDAPSLDTTCPKNAN